MTLVLAHCAARGITGMNYWKFQKLHEVLEAFYDFKFNYEHNFIILLLVSSPQLKGPLIISIKRCRSLNKENVSPSRVPKLFSFPISLSPIQDPLLRFPPSAPRLKDRGGLVLTTSMAGTFYFDS